MEITDLPVHDVRDELSAIQADFVTLVDSLTDDEWLAPTDAGHWRVKDVALHLLDDDLGRLSRDRDGDASGVLPIAPDHRDFVRSLDAKNEQWVQSAAQLSRRVVADLLRWSSTEVDAHFASTDLLGPSSVLWASASPVPRWFDLCRDLTERWVHQQHVRDAVGRPGRHARFLPDVLRTFVWAFPHQYHAMAAAGTVVALRIGDVGTWRLERAVDRWVLDEGSGATSPAATFEVAAEHAWRQLTGLGVGDGVVRTTGPDALVRPLYDVRGIIA